MAKPANEWDEEYVLSLPLGEYDWFERKGTRLLDLTVNGVNEGKVRDELAKQLSAFANTGGGQIVYGIANDGTVDMGGVSTVVKGRRTTKEWLEDIIPELVEFEVVGLNVYEIGPQAEKSAIHPGKALYIVDVPDSERAPHQSTRDRKYYVRLGGRCEPASHRLVEDIRNRIQHPHILIKQVEITAVRLPPVSIPRMHGECGTLLKVTLANTGRVKADDVCILTTTVPIPCRFEPVTGEGIALRAATVPNSWFSELKHPVYPGMETAFRLWIFFQADLEAVNAHRNSNWRFDPQGDGVESLVLNCVMYADSAPARQQSIAFQELGFGQKAGGQLSNQSAWQELLRHFGR